jgi:methanethiol oxidase
MPQWRPDQTFYPSSKMAMQAPQESVAFVAMLDPRRAKPDALAVVDLEPSSRTYGQMVERVDMPNPGDELHHFGWNACSSCLCPYSPHPHMERRYLVVPGLRLARHPPEPFAVAFPRFLLKRPLLASGRRASRLERSLLP